MSVPSLKITKDALDELLAGLFEFSPEPTGEETVEEERPYGRHQFYGTSAVAIIVERSAGIIRYYFDHDPETIHSMKLGEFNAKSFPILPDTTKSKAGLYHRTTKPIDLSPVGFNTKWEARATKFPKESK